VFAGYTPQRKSGRLSVNSLFSPATIDSSLEKLVADLRKQNDSLKEELVGCQQREIDLGQKIADSEVVFRKEMMKLEAASMQREEAARESHQQELARLRQDLDDLREARETEERAQRELASVRDEMDLLEHTKEKLSETEEKLRITRERLEHLGDVKEALAREEEAHGASVEECIRLDNELKALQPLRRQLEGYKTRAVDAEVKLAECKEDLKRLSQITGSLNSAQKEILKGARIHKEEAEELRRRLLDEEAVNEGPGVGEGLR
jgi:chromosome segregation ATPase